MDRLHFLGFIKGVPEPPSLFKIIIDYFELKNLVPTILKWEDLFFSILIAVIISLIFSIGLRNKELLPHGFQNFLEWLVENLRDQLKPILGSDTDLHLPFIGTVFIYIFFMNNFSLIPLMKTPTSNLNITIAIAIVVFFYVQRLNIKHMGFKGFLYHLCGSPKGAFSWLLAPIIFLLELMAQFTRPATLALRLAGNMIGEHILVVLFSLIGIYLFTTDTLPFALPTQIPAMLFGLLMSTIQAIVFTLLTTIYISLSKEELEHSSHK